MKKGPLTRDEVCHLEHRLAVLQSFTDVLADSRFTTSVGGSPEGRIYRGCKDGAIATCRALAERFGITMTSKNWQQLVSCTPKFLALVSVCHANATTGDIDALWEVLIAANRSACHLEDKLIDHRVDEPTLQRAILLIQSIAKRKMSEANLSFSSHEEGGKPDKRPNALLP